MNELSLIERIRRLSGRTKLVMGTGDDCAIFRPLIGEDLLFTTDQMIEDVHFLGSQSPGSIGERALARSLSDIAAMGGSPRSAWFLSLFPVIKQSGSTPSIAACSI